MGSAVDAKAARSQRVAEPHGFRRRSLDERAAPVQPSAMVSVDDVHGARGIGDAARQRRVHREHARHLVDREPALDGDRDRVDQLGCARADDDAADDRAAALRAMSFTKPSLMPIILARGLAASGSLCTTPLMRPSAMSFSCQPTVAISGAVKMFERDPPALERDDDVAERVEDGRAALHRGDRGERHERRAVAGGVDVRAPTCVRRG